MHKRREARKLALQILFANEFLKEDITSVAARISESVSEKVPQFTRDLLRITTENHRELDELIRNHLRNWDFNRVAILDRILIRLALSELLYFPDIPAEVTINEAIEISKDFCSPKARRFINGILDAIYKELLKQKKIQKNISTQIHIKKQT